ncbi:P-loop containing nucleoside triphosphate hydrolase protein [Aspergillus karnatakaensis]|uniref:BCS1 and AAA domain-containing protein n=1 Tax=Aspergillus karnatakaensis TaxID=1810916 RepID=UPI003CCDD301
MAYSSPGHVLGLIRHNLVFDPLVFSNLTNLLNTVVASVRSLGHLLHSLLEKICLVTVHVRGEDPLYSDVVRWMNDHAFHRRNFLSVMAQTTTQVPHEKALMARLGGVAMEPGNLINYRKVDESSSIQLKPFQGSRFFRFKHTWIFFRHTAPVMGGLNRFPGPEGLEGSELTLQCLSFSLSPLTKFLNEVRAYARKVSVANVTVYRAGEAAYSAVTWRPVVSRPARPISTIILDEDKKQTILSDINEYLHPQTKQWYANHGIPYRRGYLFSGPPGTGKTSLASAIAGAFGLDIYVLSLRDAGMTESEFMRLFSTVPTRCVVLLEDVDAAGITRNDTVPGQPEEPTPNKPGFMRSPFMFNMPPPKKTKESTTGVSLSGLLNGIDGVSSHEGRILIMTTNQPKSLDSALIRPGRVDLHIRFELPSHTELRNLFLAMYSDAFEIKAPSTEKDTAEDPSRDPVSRPGENEKLPNGINPAQQHTVSKDRLEELAQTFSKSMPEGRFSVAEVQGFLLRYKQQPEEACDKVESWVQEMTMEKEKEQPKGFGFNQGPNEQQRPAGRGVPLPNLPFPNVPFGAGQDMMSPEQLVQQNQVLTDLLGRPGMGMGMVMGRGRGRGMGMEPAD